MRGLLALDFIIGAVLAQLFFFVTELSVFALVGHGGRTYTDTGSEARSCSDVELYGYRKHIPIIRQAE